MAALTENQLDDYYATGLAIWRRKQETGETLKSIKLDLGISQYKFNRARKVLEAYLRAAYYMNDSMQTLSIVEVFRNDSEEKENLDRD